MFNVVAQISVIFYYRTLSRGSIFYVTLALLLCALLTLRQT